MKVASWKIQSIGLAIEMHAHTRTHMHYFIIYVHGVAPLCGEHTERPLATSVCVH